MLPSRLASFVYLSPSQRMQQSSVYIGSKILQLIHPVDRQASKWEIYDEMLGLVTLWNEVRGVWFAFFFFPLSFFFPVVGVVCLGSMSWSLSVEKLSKIKIVQGADRVSKIVREEVNLYSKFLFWS